MLGFRSPLLSPDVLDGKDLVDGQELHASIMKILCHT